MFTETELREALEHSAARARTIEEAVPAARTPRRRWAVPLAAAASIAVLAAGAVVLSDAGQRRPAAGGHPTTGTSTVSSPPARAARHVPVGLANLVDVVQVTRDDHTYYTLGGNGDVQAGTENVEKFLGGTRSIDVTVVTSPALDATRIPRDRPVRIAGTTGYYGLFRLFPLDGGNGPGSDKYLAVWTVAFRAPSGNWVFVSMEDTRNPQGLVDDPGEIVAQYERLGVRFASGRTRVPYRTGWLPTGFAFEQAYVGYGESWTTVRNGGHRIEIAVLHDRAPGDCAGECGATRRVGDYTIDVTADGYDPQPTSAQPVTPGRPPAVAPHPRGDAVARHVLDTLTRARSFGDPATWWTLADALG